MTRPIFKVAGVKHARELTVALLLIVGMCLVIGLPTGSSSISCRNISNDSLPSANNNAPSLYGILQGGTTSSSILRVTNFDTSSSRAARAVFFDASGYPQAECSIEVAAGGNVSQSLNGISALNHITSGTVRVDRNIHGLTAQIETVTVDQSAPISNVSIHGHDLTPVHSQPIFSVMNDTYDSQEERTLLLFQHEPGVIRRFHVHRMSHGAIVASSHYDLAYGALRSIPISPIRREKITALMVTPGEIIGYTSSADKKGSLSGDYSKEIDSATSGEGDRTGARDGSRPAGESVGTGPAYRALLLRKNKQNAPVASTLLPLTEGDAANGDFFLPLTQESYDKANLVHIVELLNPHKNTSITFSLSAHSYSGNEISASDAYNCVTPPNDDGHFVLDSYQTLFCVVSVANDELALLKAHIETSSSSKAALVGQTTHYAVASDDPSFPITALAHSELRKLSIGRASHLSNFYIFTGIQVTNGLQAEIEYRFGPSRPKISKSFLPYASETFPYMEPPLEGSTIVKIPIGTHAQEFFTLGSGEHIQILHSHLPHYAYPEGILAEENEALDLNGDGLINDEDLALLNAAILNGVTPNTGERYSKMDLNGDGKIDAEDFTILLGGAGVANGSIATPSHPSPSASESPTASASPSSGNESLELIDSGVVLSTAEELQNAEKVNLLLPTTMHYGGEYFIRALALMPDNTLATISPELLVFHTTRSDIFSYDSERSVLKVIEEPEPNSGQVASLDLETQDVRAQFENEQICGTNSFTIGEETFSENICLTDESSAHSLNLTADFGISACCPSSSNSSCDFEQDSTCPSDLKYPGNCGRCVDCSLIGKGYDMQLRDCVDCSIYHERAVARAMIHDNNGPKPYSSKDEEDRLLAGLTYFDDGGVGYNVGPGCVVKCNPGQEWDPVAKDCVCRDPYTVEQTYHSKELVQEQQGTCNGNVTDILIYGDISIADYLARLQSAHDQSGKSGSVLDTFCQRQWSFFGGYTGPPLEVSDDFSPPIYRTWYERDYTECEDGRTTPCDRECQNPCEYVNQNRVIPEGHESVRGREYCECKGESCCRGDWNASFCSCNCQEFKKVAEPTCATGELTDSCWCAVANDCGYDTEHYVPTCPQGTLDVTTCECKKLPGTPQSIQQLISIGGWYDDSAGGIPKDNAAPCDVKCQCAAEISEFKGAKETYQIELAVPSKKWEVRNTTEHNDTYDVTCPSDPAGVNREVVPWTRVAECIDDRTAEYKNLCNEMENRISAYLADPVYRGHVGPFWCKNATFFGACLEYGDDCTYEWTVEKKFIDVSRATLLDNTACSIPLTSTYDEDELLTQCNADDIYFFNNWPNSLYRNSFLGDSTLSSISCLSRVSEQAGGNSE